MDITNYTFNLGFRPKVTAMGTGWQAILDARESTPPDLTTLQTMYPLQMALSRGDEPRFFNGGLPKLSRFDFTVSQLGPLEVNQRIESMIFYVGASKADDDVYGDHWRTVTGREIAAVEKPGADDYYVKVEDGGYYLRFLSGRYMHSLGRKLGAYPKAEANWTINNRQAFGLTFSLDDDCDRYEIDFRLDVEFKDTSTGKCYTKIYIGDPEMTVGSGSNPTS